VAHREGQISKVIDLAHKRHTSSVDDCRHENPPGAKFCLECGAHLMLACARCGVQLPPGAKFCSECGASLSGASIPSAAPTATLAPARAGERRHLTALFCDLVNSTAIAAQLDPEEWRDTAARYQRAAAEAVTRMGGYVAKYLGDGLVAYFGYPQAHEDNAERAVRAGLAIVDAVSPLTVGLAGNNKAKLSVRVGIHAGSVVIAQGGGNEADVFGDTPNIASRVQALAEPDSVLITAAVHQLIAGLFVVEDRGAQRLKGVQQPVQVYRVIQSSVVRRRTHGFSVGAVTPFVGRDDEMRLLLNRWERAREGQGQLVLVVGEPGIGKSRLVEEFRTKIKHEPHLWVECAGEQFFENTPFHAVAQMLNQGLGWDADESKEQRVIQLERALELARMKLGEAMPLIAEMLDLPIPKNYTLPTLPPDQKRKRLLAALAGWVCGATRAQPVVMAIEDLHWVDPSTLELVQSLVQQAATVPLMLLCTARPEFRAPWPMRAHHAQIALNRLNDRHTREMVIGVAARSALARDLIDAVVSRTDGVPLFVEELALLILEADGRSVAREIPATLHDSLTARLDRLGSTREVAQVAAVIGREFSYELLHAVSMMPEDGLRLALAKLADAELVYARGTPPEATYQFKHALIHDAAYEALLKSRRRELHRRIAETIVEKFPVMAEARPEVLARHWTGAEDAERAAAGWKKAGDAAYSRAACKEAAEAYQQALTVVNTLPESSERDARELELTSFLAHVLLMAKGPGSESRQAAARARDLAEKAGDLPRLIQQLFFFRTGVLISGDYPAASALGDQVLDLARREGSRTSMALAHVAQVQVRFFRGDLVGAEEHFVHLSRLIDDGPGLDQVPGMIVNTMGLASSSAWMLGHSDSARKRTARMMAFASDSAKPYNLAFGRCFESRLYLFLRDPQRAAAAATQGLALSEGHGFSFFAAAAQTTIGLARAQLGATGEGISLIRQALARSAETGARLGLTEFLTSLAEAQALDGSISDALGTIEDALQINPDEGVYRPHALTLRGELRLKLDQRELAEADFHEAIALARKMSAKAWELRATMSLARLLRDKGCEEGRAMLSDIYNWFTEGLDTPDMQDAKALLAEL
jgi:class 3 adenylate cyclase/tetratricopeptide (TPR) repeat protein